MTDHATLNIHRDSAFVDRIRKYGILVNDRLVAMIGRSESVSVLVPAGEIIITAKIDWCGAVPLKLSVEPNQIIDIKVSNRLGALGALYAITFGARKYLKLEVISGPPSE